MPVQVVMGAMMTCPFGVAPSTLMVLPANRVTCSKVPAANIMDHIPMTNIMPFGVCNSLANPTTAAATSAALGVLTPTPCIPATAAPWAPGAAQTTIANMPALHNACTLTCNWGGVITITNPGQTQTTVT